MADFRYKTHSPLSLEPLQEGKPFGVGMPNIVAVEKENMIFRLNADIIEGSVSEMNLVNAKRKFLIPIFHRGKLGKKKNPSMVNSLGNNSGYTRLTLKMK